MTLDGRRTVDGSRRPARERPARGPRRPRRSPSAASSPACGRSRPRKGDRMCVFMLDDATGSIEIVVFPEAFKQFGHLAENGQMVLVKGKFEKDDESARILASEIAPIDMVRERLATSVAIRLSTPPHDRATFEKLWDVLRAAQGRPARGVRHPRAGSAHPRHRRRQRHPRPSVRAAGVGSREDLRCRLGELAMSTGSHCRDLTIPCHRLPISMDDLTLSMPA